MLDPRRLRAQPEQIAALLKRRGFVFDLNRFSELESQRKTLQVETERLQAMRNAGSKRIGQAKAAGDNVAPILESMDGLKQQLEHNATELAKVQEAFNAFAMDIPNLPSSDVPDGSDESGNVEVRRWGDPRSFPFAPQDHATLGEALGLVDFAAAARITGARFSVLHRGLARLHRALIQFMLDTHVQQHGYEEVYVPYIVSGESLRGTGQLPKFADDLYRLAGDQDWWLAPTAEVPVTNLLRDQILEAADLPRKFVAHTPCFRAEAGAAGKDTRGMIRQHQFEKVELVQAVAPEQSHAALDELLGHAESILRRLELPYRVVSLCTGDMGFSAAKTYDIEVWLPSQKQYREISSCSNFEDFQARRMQARYRRKAGDKAELLHTLNGSGLAVGRTLVAILENFQDAQGGFTVPYVLHNYMGGTTRIEAG